MAYSFVYIPLQVLYPVECMDNSTRAKGVAMSGTSSPSFPLAAVTHRSYRFRWQLVRVHQHLRNPHCVGQHQVQLRLHLRRMGRYRIRSLVLVRRRDRRPIPRTGGQDF